MTGEAASPNTFISYNSHDRAAARGLAELLRQHDVVVRYDETDFVRGQPFPDQLHDLLATTASMIVLLGPHDVGRWQRYEIVVALHEHVHRFIPVIPVILPGGPTVDEVPRPLKVFGWIEARSGWNRACIDSIVGGITGELPETSVLRRESVPSSRHRRTIGGDRHRLIAKLEHARFRRAHLEELNENVDSIIEEIKSYKRALRDGGVLHAGDTLNDRYRLIEYLGRGGYGTVWRARDQENGDSVALKVLHGSRRSSEIDEERFLRGASRMAALDHPSIVKVLRQDCEDLGFRYYVMELIDGPDVNHAVTAKTLSRDQLLAVIVDTASGLAAAHAKKWVHRDVAPKNILITKSGQAKVTDFDLLYANDTTGGTEGGLLATAGYAAPEVHTSEEVDSRADIYSLAMTVLFALMDDTVRAGSGIIQPQQIAALHCSSELRQVLTKATCQSPDDRYATVVEFSEALQVAWDMPYVPDAAEELGTVESDDLRNERGSASIRRTGSGRWWAAGGIGAVGVAGYALLAMLGVIPAAWNSKTSEVPVASAMNPPSPQASKSVVVEPRPSATAPNPFPAAQSPTPASPSGQSSTRPAVATPSGRALASAQNGPHHDILPADVICPLGMVYIPPATFTMGSPGGSGGVREREVTVYRGYCVDRFEVSVSAYDSCIADSGCSPPATADVVMFCSGAKKNKIPAGEPQGDHPITCVDWGQAAQYCKHAGKRLPTEQEWELAARGANGKKGSADHYYPWGAAYPNERLVNACDTSCRNYHREIGDADGAKRFLLATSDNYAMTAPVGSFPKGASPYELLDMAGNVAEWVDGMYCDYKVDDCLPKDPYRVARGGSWRTHRHVFLRSYYRERLQDKPYNYVGFRCAARPSAGGVH